MSTLMSGLKSLLSDTYTLYLKTQNYHWHVKGPNFKPFHELFEEQYTELAMAIDTIAERIRMLGERVPSTFNDFMAHRTLNDGNSDKSANEMIHELHSDHLAIIASLNQILEHTEEDDVTATLISDRLAIHEKTAWMLHSSFE